jgi:hypothetical protein
MLPQTGFLAKLLLLSCMDLSHCELLTPIPLRPAEQRLPAERPDGEAIINDAGKHGVNAVAKW